MSKIFLILFTLVFTENYVLVQFLGICPFLGVSQKFSSCIGMSGAVIFVMTLASAVTWGIYQGLMVAFHLEFMRTIIFILVIAALVQLVEITLKKFMPPLYKALGVYLPLITTNCAVLAVTILNIDERYNFVESCVSGFSAGLGFSIALILFCGVRKSLERAKPPKCFEGLPITLVAAAFTSMTFMGFTGMAENLFGG